MVLSTPVARPRVRIDSDLQTQIDDYAARYRDVFARADQAKLFGLYLRGLAFGEHRRNVESIAEQLGEASGAALAQSLQHFVSQSPWDADLLLRRYRESLPRPRGHSVWVVHDGIIPKKGRASVGVLRQYARALGRKVSCQVAVVVSEVSTAAVPLGLRLYLPASWLREHEKSAARTIPETARQPWSKAEIALQLLDELRRERPAAAVVAEASYSTSPQFVEGLRERQIDLHIDGGEASLSQAQERFEWIKESLGLGHYEGRTWVGWHHHAAAVLAAYGFLVERGSSSASTPEA